MDTAIAYNIAHLSEFLNIILVFIEKIL